MDDLGGARVFFKRKALDLLRGYWCRRWDALALRHALSLSYVPRYHVESSSLGGYYVTLRGSPFLWYRGLFSVGRHLPSGRYVQAPVNEPLTGLGPRELVFPASLAQHLNDLPLLGDAHRYQRCLGLVLAPVPHAQRVPLSVRVESLRPEVPRGLVDFSGAVRLRTARPVLSLVGRVRGGIADGAEICVPVSELSWRRLGAL